MSIVPEVVPLKEPALSRFVPRLTCAVSVGAMVNVPLAAFEDTEPTVNTVESEVAAEAGVYCSWYVPELAPLEAYAPTTAVLELISVGLEVEAELLEELDSVEVIWLSRLFRSVACVARLGRTDLDLTLTACPVRACPMGGCWRSFCSRGSVASRVLSERLSIGTVR